MTITNLIIEERHSLRREKTKKNKKERKKLAGNDDDVACDSAQKEIISKEEQKEKKAKNKTKRSELTDDNDTDNNGELTKIKKKKKRIRTKERNDIGMIDVYEEDSMGRSMETDPNTSNDSPSRTPSTTEMESSSSPLHVPEVRPLVESSALPPKAIASSSTSDEIDEQQEKYPISLLLFYQYVSPLWDDSTYKLVQEEIEKIGLSLQIHGRVRVAKEGLNCTLSGNKLNIQQFCFQLRQWKPNVFRQTEFKLTHQLENKYHFPSLKIIPVLELVHYGLDGKSISTVPPPSVLEQYSGTHLEPIEYHQKLAEANTVVIDVRNHYEAAIGHFNLPTSDISADTGNKSSEPSSTFLDPKMRKSTEFPIWLDHPTTKEQLKGKQVLMYCTGGIRCERASALLQYKIQNDPAVQALDIKGVYQLQGGIDKYFKQFPDGGYWVGKNYTFDKRCAHSPVETVAAYTVGQDTKETDTKRAVPLGKCAACSKLWDNYGGKPCRCPTCGVPNLICKDCFTNHRKKIKNIRCDLCVEQNVTSKKELRDKQQQEVIEFEQRNESLTWQHPKISGTSSSTTTSTHIAPSNSSSLSVLHTSTNNSDGTTRLFLRNMCRNSITEEQLVEVLPNVTHIVWKVDGKSGKFFGQGWVEMETVCDASNAVSQSGSIIVCGRPLFIEYQPPDGKDLWPPPRSAINKK